MPAASTGPVVMKGWFTKKPKSAGRSRKRYFTLSDDGTMNYYAAVSPEGECHGFKGQFQLYKDSVVSRDGSNLLITAGDREWKLTAIGDNTEQVAKDWEAIVSSTISKSTSSGGVAAAGGKSSAVSQLSDKCAGALKSATAQMKTFGFAGSIKVTGSVFGVSLSMGVGVEVEATEGEMETPVEEKKADKSKKKPKKGKSEQVEEVLSEDEDEQELDGAEKESKLQKNLAKATRAALGKVKVVAFTMKKYNISGTIGVAADLTVFGTGFTVEFEIELSSALTDVEFEEMEHEYEAKKAMTATAAAK